MARPDAGLTAALRTLIDFEIIRVIDTGWALTGRAATIGHSPPSGGTESLPSTVLASTSCSRSSGVAGSIVFPSSGGVLGFSKASGETVAICGPFDFEQPAIKARITTTAKRARIAISGLR